jgi:Phage integrase family
MLESLTYDELLAVLRAARAQSTRNWCMILAAFSHGLRASEVCDLKLSNVHDGHVTIHRLKGSRTTLHQLVPHRGMPLLDEVKALQGMDRTTAYGLRRCAIPLAEGRMYVRDAVLSNLPHRGRGVWPARTETTSSRAETYDLYRANPARHESSEGGCVCRPC